MDEVSGVGVLDSGDLKRGKEEKMSFASFEEEERKEEEEEETYELVGEEKDGLEGELPAAEVEEILQTRSEKIHHHRVVVALEDERRRKEGRLAPSCVRKPVARRRRHGPFSRRREAHLSSEPSNERHSDSSSERLVDLALVLQLRVLGLDGLELDGDFLAGDDVDSEVDVT